jgi:hypothetical protein
MRRRALAAALGVFAAALAQTPEPKLTQAEARLAVAAILPDLQAIRGLKFKVPVPVTVIDDTKAREYALARFRKMTPESKIHADETTYRLLGLIPKDLDVLKTLLDVLEEQAGGFYDPDTSSFYLLDDMPKDATRSRISGTTSRRASRSWRTTTMRRSPCRRSSRGARPRRRRSTSRTPSRTAPSPPMPPARWGRPSRPSG